MTDQLSKLKIALQIKDNKHDDMLNLYLQDATDALKLLISIKSSENLPLELEYIVRAVAVKKFNRFRNEGMLNYSQDGESITFNANDFDDFKDVIDQWKKDQNGINKGMWVNPYEIRH